MPRVFFDPEFLDSPRQFIERFEDPCSVSLVCANELDVTGPVFFEKNVGIEGTVKIKATPGMTYRIRRGTTLRDGNYP